MKKEEAISYLQQLYPNGGHCWLDEQRIEAIDMAINALQEEPKDKCKGCNNVKGCVTCVNGSEFAHYEEAKIPPVFEEGYWERLGEDPVSDIDFEQELYKAFGQVKDFTLGLQIAKRFYDMGKNHQEPVSEDWEEAYRNWVLSHNDGDKLYCKNAWRAAMDWQKQLDKMPVSEDLESFANYIGVKEETKIHIDDLETEIYVGMALKEAVKKAVKFGAKWQREQDQSTIELAEDHAMLAGMEKMKEQMMAKAVETTFNVSLPSGLYDKLWIKGCKEGDKLLVIKKGEMNYDA